jgi:hypothetical protein
VSVGGVVADAPAQGAWIRDSAEDLRLIMFEPGGGQAARAAIAEVRAALTTVGLDFLSRGRAWPLLINVVVQSKTSPPKLTVQRCPPRRAPGKGQR